MGLNVASFLRVNVLPVRFGMKRISLALVSLSIAACGPLDDMKDMKNTTNELLKVSKEMNEKMNSMNTATQTMGKTTVNMADEMKGMRGDL